MILLIQRFDGFMEFFKGGGRGIEVRSSYFVEYWIIVSPILIESFKVIIYWVELKIY